MTETTGLSAEVERRILAREQALRAWFTRDADAELRQIDGLDIGWGGVQRWATARMPSIAGRLHLDLACGYGTFLAQLGWRFPDAGLIGLNIDFAGSHALARPLLVEAGVNAALLQGDARRIPLADGTLGSASCFLGLQDVEIAFGQEGVRQVVSEAVRVLREGGLLILLDEFTLERFVALLDGLPVAWVDGAERELDVRWSREVATRAAALYAEGWVAQMRLPAGDSVARETAYRRALARMRSEVEAQMATQGYVIPFGPVRMAVVRKTGRQNRRDTSAAVGEQTG
jgi:SAM-dependent methyltransferase